MVQARDGARVADLRLRLAQAQAQLHQTGHSDLLGDLEEGARCA